MDSHLCLSSRTVNLAELVDSQEPEWIWPKGGVPLWNVARKLADLPLYHSCWWYTMHLEHAIIITIPSSPQNDPPLQLRRCCKAFNHMREVYILNSYSIITVARLMKDISNPNKIRSMQQQKLFSLLCPCNCTSVAIYFASFKLDKLYIV